MEAQVISAGASYFTVEPVYDANGEPLKDPAGAPVISTLRRNATFGQTVEMSEHEFQRLQALGAVREVSDQPLRSELAQPTPFGVPVPDADGNLRAFPGPIMGDPAPTAGLDDISLTTAAGALTPEQSEELRRQSLVGAGDDESGAAIDERDYESASKAALQAEVDSRGLEVEGTGSGGNVVKDDLIAALEEDDENEEG